ncbi:MAG: isoamylase [Actinomycetota bacterium]|nr:isoamylase [Actinomycetota bacterium]
MRFPLTVHYDNGRRFVRPHLWIFYAGSALVEDVAPTSVDDFGPVFETDVSRPEFGFTFKEGPGTFGPWEGPGFDRSHPTTVAGIDIDPNELWCRGDRAFVYTVRPADPEQETAPDFLAGLATTPGFPAGTYVSDTGGLSGLGATVLADGTVLFGLYHPTAARVHVTGSFNGWQAPGEPLRLYEGWFGAANMWLGVVPAAAAPDEYRFVVDGGVPVDGGGRHRRFLVDPYARCLGHDRNDNNPVVVDPGTFAWTDAGWRTPDPADLILYELSVHGFTDGDLDVKTQDQGRFGGITERIRGGYFDDLGVTALSLMPLAEVPSPQGPTSLGYDPSLYCAVERDFGGPDELRTLVDVAHAKGLAVLLDMVFNHTSNAFNPMWGAILEHPAEELDASEGGLYFSGSTPWGNRVATEKEDVQNLLVDACKLFMHEYHVDGFRFDATHSSYMDHGFLLRLASEVRAAHPAALLVAENLPNQTDLNRQGWDGYAQWSELFHDKLKAVLREGPFESQDPGPDNLADAFYFGRSHGMAHTNNSVNYTESHDENSVPFEVGFTPWLDHPAAKDRKGRLALLATMVALGQPMIYMGNEFNVERPRNVVTVAWPTSLDDHGFYQWARRVTRLRRRYPGLRLRGFDPAGDGRFEWVLGPWMDDRHGGGRRVLGWRSRPNADPRDALVVLLNFEGHEVSVDLELGIPGTWVKLADIDRANDVPPEGTNGPGDPTALHSADGRFAGFDMPGSSGFVYKWEA